MTENTFITELNRFQTYLQEHQQVLANLPQHATTLQEALDYLQRQAQSQGIVITHEQLSEILSGHLPQNMGLDDDQLDAISGGTRFDFWTADFWTTIGDNIAALFKPSTDR